MTVINQNSISGITSITAASGSVQIFNSDGSTGSLTNLAGVNVVGVVTATSYVVSAGTTSAPSISPSGDSNTGIFFPSDDTIAFGEGGSEVARFDSSGRFAIGTNSPLSGAQLTVAASGLAITGQNLDHSANSIRIGEEGSGAAQIRCYGPNASTNGSLTFRMSRSDGSNSQDVIIDSSGRLGIGTASPSAPLHVNGTANNTSITLSVAGTVTGYIGPAGFLGGSDVNMGYRVESGNNHTFYVGATERARIDSSGRLLIGTSSNISGGVIQSVGNIDAYRYSANSGSSGLRCYHSRNTTSGSHTIIQNDDQLGFITFEGSDGTQFTGGANIVAYVDGTPGTNDLPARLVFSTTADGASSPTERARITSGGYFKATSTGSYESSAGLFHEFIGNSASGASFNLVNKNGSYAGALLNGGCDRAATTAYDFQNWYSTYSGTFDLEFRLRGDGTGLCDGSWTGGGADYAEYFEWSDGNPNQEDRCGISVVLEGKKIRPALDGEEPIGVISGNPSVVGDAAWNKWSGKYLRDDYGRYIQEDYEVINDEGETVIQQRRKLNPEYNPDQEYISREERPEWDTVGLVGKLRIRKGQPTGSRWIKMDDINDSVEEWLVR